MIRNESEYQSAQSRLSEEAERIKHEEAALRDEGFIQEEIDRLVDPIRSFHAQLREEVEFYERLKRGQFQEILNLQGLGQLLIGLRIYLGISQRELADKLGVNESQVSRDERNEYHGIKLERATGIIQAMGVRIKTSVEVESLPPPQKAA